MRVEIRILIIVIVCGLIIGGLAVTGAFTGSPITCNPPYIIHANDCCLDQNSNGICDTDDKEAMPECPHECCEGVNYKTKACSGGTICENNRCVNPDCSFECCDDEYYKKKNCNYNEECVNNQCVVAPCPYKCCTGKVYQTKTCSSGYVCVNDLCEEIKIPKLSPLIDACREGIDIYLGEVLDVYVTLKNIGTKEAMNIQIISTSTDVDKILDSSKGVIGALGTGDSVKFKLRLDTKMFNESFVTVNVYCDECQPQAISTSSGDCLFDWEAVADKIEEYGTDILDALVPG